MAFDPEDVTQSPTIEPELDLSTGIANEIFWIDDNNTAWIDRSEGPYLPTWQVSPLWHTGYDTYYTLHVPRSYAPLQTNLSRYRHLRSFEPL
jgi:hypothetical protein